MQFTISLAEYILSGLVVLLLGWVIYLQVRIGRFLTGKNGSTLEDIIASSQKDIVHLQKFEDDCIKYFTDVEKRVSRSIQAIETERFNPFKGTGEGGTQSFATALVSEKGDGVIISSLYSRDRISLFSKPLTKFKSAFELTEEEKNVVDRASAAVKK